MVDYEALMAKFRMMTDGLDPVESRIALFEKVRDIPFRPVLDLYEGHGSPMRTLLRNEGSSEAKSILLASLFEMLGIKVMFVTFSFRWENLKVQYPSEVRQYARAIPVTYHTAFRASIDDRWVLIDPVYDSALANVGFPINRTWDGVSDTKMAVLDREECVHIDHREREKYAVLRFNKYDDDQIASLNDFYGKLNAWFDSLRSEK